MSGIENAKNLFILLKCESWRISYRKGICNWQILFFKGGETLSLQLCVFFYLFALLVRLLVFAVSGRKITSVFACRLSWVEVLPRKETLRSWERPVSALSFCNHAMQRGLLPEIWWDSAAASHSPFLGAGEELFKILGIGVVSSSHSFLVEKPWEGTCYIEGTLWPSSLPTAS